MKRVVIALSFLLTILFVSCTKEQSLAGTKWLGAEGGSTMELAFTSTNFELKEVNTNETILGSYAYDAPDITFIATTMRDSYGRVQTGGGSFTGVVNGKNLTIDMNGTPARFIKQ